MRKDEVKCSRSGVSASIVSDHERTRRRRRRRQSLKRRVERWRGVRLHAHVRAREPLNDNIDDRRATSGDRSQNADENCAQLFTCCCRRRRCRSESSPLFVPGECRRRRHQNEDREIMNERQQTRPRRAARFARSSARVTRTRCRRPLASVRLPARTLPRLASERARGGQLALTNGDGGDLRASDQTAAIAEQSAPVICNVFSPLIIKFCSLI